ncbi:MAG: hypothetical protein Q9196_003884 [Gyalolechia fulgens]
MASGNRSAQGQSQPRLGPNPGQLETNNTTTRDQRFSWQDTPLEVQRSTFHQYSTPTNSTIDESPISPRDGYQLFPKTPQEQAQSEYAVEKPMIERTRSPYNLPPPAGTHPAYSAPVVEDHKPQQPARGHPSSEINKSSESSMPHAAAHGRKDSSVVTTPAADKASLVYNPSSLAGPNATLENHRPGQIAHPNATIEPRWKHGLCEIDMLCCVGMCCPCIIYGKTQYRISRKTQKEDPTNMLGGLGLNSARAHPETIPPERRPWI